MTVRQRSCTLNIRLTVDEKLALEAAARQHKISAGALVRLAVFSRELPDTRTVGIDPGALSAYRQLQPLQSNLNQLARHLNLAAQRGDLYRVVTRSEVGAVAKMTTAAYLLLRKLRREMIGADVEDEQ